jgi:TP901 family phage tail tape measure protein
MAEDIILRAGVDTSAGERRLAELVNRANRTPINLNANVDGSSLIALSKPLGRITGQADEFTKSMEAANARVLAFGASVGVINALSNAFKNLISSTIEVENSLTEIKVVGGETFSNLKDVSSGIFDVARQTGLSFKQAAEATLEFSRQGKNLESSLQAAKAALILTRTTGLDATEAVKGLTSAVNVFSESGLTMEKIVNKLAAVDTKFAVGSRDLIEGISRSASVAQEAGVSFDELSAFITTLQEKTGRGGAVIGNALKTIFTRVQNPEIISDIKNLGIAIEDTSGNFLPATQIIKNLASEFDFLDKNLQKSILLKVGGGFQIDKLAALLNDVAKSNGTFQRSLSESASAQSQAYNKTAQLNETLSASFQNLLTSSKQLGSNIGSITFSSDFTNIIKSLGSGLKSLNDAIFGKDDGFKKSGETTGQTIAKSILSGIGSVISGPALGVFLAILTKLGYDFVKFSIQGLQTLLKITSQSKEEESIQKSIGEMLSNNLKIQQKIFSLGDDRVEQAKQLLQIYKQQADETKKMEETKKAVSGLLYESGLRGVSTGQPKIISKASSGYVPNLSKAIRDEKQQSPPSSKIIVDKNFPFGGGVRGTMVYNSNETRISNFNGSGGDAIIPNYPIKAASGYVPNFAKTKTSSEQSQKPDLLIDASVASVAGITAGGERGVIDKAKGKTIGPDLLKKYEGSPFVDYLSNFGKINLVNVPVGNVYRTREGIKENEASIKKNFTDRINTALRPNVLNFIDTELNRLKLPTGGGLRGNLNNLRFDIINSSSAGYILEEILKAPTLTDAEKLGQYKAQSESSFFDIYNLSPEFAEMYGLPKRTYEYTDVKLGFKELKDTITSKYLNQAILEGGGANKLIKNAAGGYVPNFSDEIIPISKEMSELGSIQSKNNADPFDKFKGNIKLIRQAKSNEDYNKASVKIAQKIYPTKGQLDENSLERVKNFFSKSGIPQLTIKGYDSLLRNPNNNFVSYISRTKGILGEIDAKKLLNKNEILDKNSFFDFIGYSDARTRKQDSATNILKKGVNSWLSNKNIKDNNIIDRISLPEMTAVIASDTQFSNAARGYIPNFANINADILTVNPAAASMSIDQFIQKYLGSEYSTGLSGTSANAVKMLGDSNAISEAKRDFLMSMLGPNWLATFNRDDEANKARRTLVGQKSRTGSRMKYESGFMMSSGMKAQKDLSTVIEGTFSGNAKELVYEELDKKAEKIFQQNGLSNTWQEIIDSMTSVGSQYTAEMIQANNSGTKAYFDYNAATIQTKNPETGKTQYENIKEKIRKATGILRPKLIEGLLEGEKGVQALLLNPPAADKDAVGEQSKYLALLDPKAANLKKMVSDYLINPNIEPLSENEAFNNRFEVETIRDFLDQKSPNYTYRKNIGLDELKSLRRIGDKNPQLRKFFSEGPQGAFEVKPAANKRLGAFWKPDFPQDTIEKMSTILTAVANRKGIFQLSNLDLGYSGSSTSSVPYGYDTFASSLDFPSSQTNLSTPQSIKYGDYKNNKVYYDSIAKWKYDAASKSMIRQAAKGFIPNFSELSGTGSGMLYSDSNFSELGGGGSGKFLAPKSGEGLGQKIFYKLDSDKLKHEYNVNKSIKEFEKENPALFAKNAISFTNVGKILTKNGLAAGFEREVIGGLGVDEFATGTFTGKPGQVTPKANFAFFLSELLAQAAVKNVVGEYRKKYGDNSLRIDDVYAQNFKVNDIMQKALIDETNQFFKQNKKAKDQDVDNYIRGIRGSPLIDSLNEKFGSAGGRHTMFDTQGFSANAQNAAKGYIPNFAGSGIIQSLKDKAKKIIANPIAQTLFDQAIETLFGLPEGFEASEMVKKINFALTSSDPRLELMKINVNKKRENRQAKIRDYLSRNAFSGYIPNFVGGAIGDAFMREKMQSGLPSSQISLTKDSRLVNNLNPSGFAVVNKRDEPDGKVPSDRIASAYKNAANGFIPNFSGSQPVSNNRVAANTLMQAVTNGGSIPAIENANKENLTKAIIENTKTVQNSTQVQQRLYPLSGSGSIRNNFSSTNPIPMVGRSFGGQQATNQQTAQQQAANQQQETSNDKNISNQADFGDFAKKFVVLQSSISFLSGALSSLGDEGQKAAQVLSSLGQLAYLGSQGGDLFKLLNKGRGVGDTISSAKEGFAAGGIRGLIGNAGKAAVGGQAAVAATGLGGGMGAALALGATAAGAAAGLYGLYKVFDGLGDVLAKNATQGRKMAEIYDQLASRYSVKLTDAQQKRLDEITEASDVKGTSLAGSMNRAGFGLSSAYRRTKEFVGIDDETWRTRLERSLGKLGVSGENSQQFTKLFGPILTPSIEEKVGVKTEQGTIFDKTQFTNEFVRQISSLVNDLRPAIDQKARENYNAYNVIDYRTDLRNKREANTLNEEEAKDLKAMESKNPLNFLNVQRKVMMNARSKATLETVGGKAQEMSLPALEKAAEAAAPQEAKLKRIETFKREMEIQIELIKLQSSLTSEKERSLSIEKELLSTSASQKFEKELYLKQLQDEKQLQVQLKTFYATSARDRAAEYVTKVSSTGVTQDIQDSLTAPLNRINAATTIQEFEQAYDEMLKVAELAEIANNKAIAKLQERLNTSVDLPEEEKGKIQKQIEERSKGVKLSQEFRNANEKEKNLLLEQFRINRINSTELTLQKSITDQINNAISLRKDVLTAQLNLQQKELEINQRILEIQNKISDARFKSANINLSNPNEDPFISQSRDERRNIGTSFEREMQQIQADIQKENLTNKQNIFNAAMQRGAKPEQLEQIKNAETIQQSYDILDEVLKNNSSGFENSVQNAANYFLQACQKAGEFLIKSSVEKDVAAESGTVDVFIEKLKDTYKLNEIPQYTARQILPQEDSAEKTKKDRETLASEERLSKIKQYTLSIEKRLLDFRTQALSYSLQVAQKQLELEKQRIDTAQKLKDLQFEGQTMQEYNPVKAQKLRNAYQIEQGVSQAESNDLLANKSYLNDAKSKAFSEAQGRGATAEDLKFILEANNTKDIEDRLTSLISEQIKNTGNVDVGDILINASKEAAKYIIEAGKIFNGTVSGKTGADSASAIDLPLSEASKKLTSNPEETARLIAKSKLGNTPISQLDQAKQIADAQRANEAIRQNNESSFSTGINQSLGEMQGRVDTFQNSIGREIPNAFRDGLVSAMKSAADVNNTKPLKDRLLDVASAFIDRINTKLMENIADKLTSGLAGTGSGLMSAASSGIGSIFGFASGGKVSGGSGVKDDVPAMLTSGEFVVTKNAVNKYGPEFLSALNSGKIKKFAAGGFVERDLTKYSDAKNFININSPIRGNLAFGANGEVENLIGTDRESIDKNNPGLYDYSLKKAQTDYYAKNSQNGDGGFFMPGQNGQGAIMGQRNLLSFATQNTTSSKFDRFASGADFAAADIGAGSENLTLSALRDQNNLKNKEFYEAKQKSLDLYLSGVDATKQKTDLEEQSRKQQQEYKDQQKKARRQFWINAGIAAGGSLIGSGLSAMAAGAANRIQSYSSAGGAEMSSWDKLGYGLKGSIVGAEGSGGLAGYFRGNGNATQRLDTFQAGRNGGMYAWDNSAGKYVSAKYNPYSSFINPNTNPFAYRKAAGGYVAGAGNGDNVPTLLNGGEFVVSKQATQRIGTQKLQEINSNSQNGDSEVASRIEAKLEDLIQKISGVGTINITVNGTSGKSENEKVDSSSGSENNKELARKIKEMVLYTIKEEKRLGGMLR